jgi:tetratricopeptide (TPR) repeat protein
MKASRAGALMVLALVSSPAVAAADTPPSAWDFARDPAERDRWKLHMTVEALLHPPMPEADMSSLDDAKADERGLEEARVGLEEADAAHSPDVRLAFDLGVVYERLATLQADDSLQEKVVAVLVPALDAAPENPAATEALFALACAFAHLDRPREELTAWRRYIPKLTDDERRLTPMMNMGEAEMRVGQIDAALSTFREALDISQSLPNSAALSESYALILWDIAIALDRQGDPLDALRTAAKARAFSWSINVPAGLSPGILKQTGWDAIQDYVDVFFVPDWEREWYLALGEAAEASAASDPRVAATGWAAAERHWGTYFSRATEPRQDSDSKDARDDMPRRWSAIAKSRRDHAHRARLAAEKLARGMPAPPPVGSAP